MSGFDEGLVADDDHGRSVRVWMEEVILQPGLYFSEVVGECGFSGRGDGFGGNVDLEVVSVTMEAETMTV